MAILQGREADLSEPLPYKNYVTWSLTRERKSKSEEFFSEKLGDVEYTTAPFGIVDVHGDGACIEGGTTGT